MAVLLIFPVFLQTVINLIMLSIGGQRHDSQNNDLLVGSAKAEM